MPIFNDTGQSRAGETGYQGMHYIYAFAMQHSPKAPLHVCTSCCALSCLRDTRTLLGSATALPAVWVDGADGASINCATHRARGGRAGRHQGQDHAGLGRLQMTQLQTEEHLPR
jgi:hypothetical protein